MGIFKKEKAEKTEKTSPKKSEPKNEETKSAASLRARMGKSIMLHPHVSEKALREEPNGRYVFWVRGEATKPEIRKEISERFGVAVVSVHTLIKKGKETHWRGKAGRKSAMKKAIITLKEGQKIEL